MGMERGSSASQQPGVCTEIIYPFLHRKERSLSRVGCVGRAGSAWSGTSLSSVFVHTSEVGEIESRSHPLFFS